MNVRRVFGFAIISISLLVCVGWLLWPSAQGVPIDIPIKLHPFDRRNATFRADETWTYLVEIVFKKKEIDKEFICSTGATDFVSCGCEKASSLLHVDWSITSGGKRVAGGSSDDNGFGTGGDGFTRELGDFRAEKGTTYELNTLVRQDGGVLNASSPRLAVEIHPSYGEDLGGITLEVFLGTLIGMIVGILLCVPRRSDTD